MDIHFSSKSNEWSTPQDLYDKLNCEFNFTLDPCASEANHKCEKYYTVKENGLAQDWSGESVFMNPPYGRQIKLWIKKAFETAKQGGVVVALIPARTDTTYWHQYIFKHTEIRFLKGRLKFGCHKNSAPFPSAVVIFKGDKQ